MAVNNPEVQILKDIEKRAIVKITSYFNAPGNANVTVIQANTLGYANNSQPCIVSITDVQQQTAFANGLVQLYWVGKNGNTAIMNLGGDASGHFECYIQNPLFANANLATGNSGDIGVYVNGAEPNDSYTIILKLQKEAGFANADIAYNDNTFHP